ncbi:MAG TPA: hypothetical protein VIE17_00230 [Methylophilaceae bacterium]
MKIILMLMTAFLSACGTAPVRDVQLVDKAVAVSCVENPPAIPGFKTDSELKAMPDYEVMITLLSERIRREIYESELEAVLQACK